MPSRQYMNDHWKPERGIIVEGGWPHHPFSVTFNVTNDGAEFHCGSLQWQGNGQLGKLIGTGRLLERDLAHRGNLVFPARHGSSPITWAHLMTAKEALAPAMELVRASGYPGLICADFAWVNAARMALLEFNPRTSHSHYVQGAQVQISKRFGKPLVAVGANVSLHSSIRTYRQAKARLTRFGTKVRKPRGVVMYHTPLIPLGLKKPKAGLIAFGKDFAEARGEFERAEAELNA
ncbi:MAG: hypothetical protein AAB932_01085, partial [Patescibacteria group bacterium]